MLNENTVGYFVTEIVTSLEKATEIMRRLNTRTHKACGFYYVLNDLDLTYASRTKVRCGGSEFWTDVVFPEDKNGKPLQLQRSYKLGTELYHLRVYRNRPVKA